MTKELPSLAVFIKCGNCYNEVDHDGEVYHCDHCKLQWTHNNPFDEAPATFLEDEDGELPEPCGHEDPDPHREGKTKTLEPGEKAPNYWPEGARAQHFAYTLLPCIIPGGHDEDHCHPSDGVFTYFDEDGLAIAQQDVK